MKFFNYKFLVTLVCIIGFTYHTISLSMEYLSGKTVVNILFGPLFKEELPALTICPGAMAIDKVANLSVELVKLHQDYLNYVKLVMSVGENSSMNEDKLFQITNIHKIASNIIKSMMMNGDLNIGNMFYNYTYSYDYEIMPNIRFYLHETSIIEGELEHMINKSDIIRLNGKDHYYIRMNPIESMVLDISAFKCYTFFSHLDTVWKNVKIDFKRMTILADFDMMSYPHGTLKLPLFIHSANDLPSFDQGKMLALESGLLHAIQYSTIKILRLGSDYETDCRNYGQDFPYVTRSSCIVSCVKHYHDTICGNNKLPEMANLMIEEFIKINYNKTITNSTIYSRIKQDALVNCSKQCNLNCHYKYYPANINPIGLIENRSHSNISMEHNQMPDVLIEYIPETSFISFICNFGGLMGMWLGLSFESIINDLLAHLLKLKSPTIIVNNINLNLRLNQLNPINYINIRHAR